MRVLVAHHLLVRVGGGERVSAVLIDELLRRGYEVAVATTCRADIVNLFERYFERPLPTPVRSYSLFPRFYPVFGIYQRLASFIPVGKAIRSENPDIVFIDHEIYKPLRSVLKGRRLVHFVHFPWNPRLADRNWELYGMTLPDKYRHFPFDIYWKGYIALQRLVSVDENFADVICANSQFTAQVVKMVWDREATVIYPPVSVNDFYSLPPSEKGDIVVHLGRISAEKRIEDAITAIARCETDIKLVVIGGLIPANMPYLMGLKKLVKDLRLEGRVEFHTNVPFKFVKDTLARAKILMSAMHFEHFGISVCEGLASGCVPIVHRSGGPLEIINNGQYGFSYLTPREAAQYMDRLIGDAALFAKMSRAAVKRAKAFDESIFRMRMMEIVEKFE